MLDVIKEISISEKEFTEINYERLKKSFGLHKNNLIHSYCNKYLTVDSLIEINSIITGSYNITLRKVNVKPYGHDKMYIDKNLMEDKLHQIIDQFNKRKIAPTNLYSILLNKIHPSYDINGRTCKILFANNDKINLLMRQKLKN